MEYGPYPTVQAFRFTSELCIYRYTMSLHDSQYSHSIENVIYATAIAWWIEKYVKS